MSDATAPDSSHDSSPDNREWYIQQWETLCEELGASTPNEVLSRVQTLRRRADLDDPDGESEGLVTISEVEEVFRELNSKIAKLRKRNSALVERLDNDDEAGNALSERHQQTEELLDVIGVNTVEEAQAHVEQLEDQLEELYQEKEQLSQAGLSDAEEALDELEEVRSERNALRQERDALQAQLEESDDTSSSSSTEGPDTSALEVASVIRDEIGISSLEQAVAFKKVVKDVHDRIQKRAYAHDLTPDSTPNSVVGMLRNMTKNLSELPDPGALSADAATRLGLTDPSDLDTLVETTRQIAQGVAASAPSDDATDAPDPDADDVLAVLQDIATHLDDLPAPDTAASKDDGLPAEAADVLGIHSVEDAHELDALIDDMSERLAQLREEHEKLAEADLSVEGALTMIDNMEAQLADLYHRSDRDTNGQTDAPAPALQSLDTPLLHRIKTLVDLPAEADDLPSVMEQLVERLETLAAEQEALDDAGLTAEEALSLIDNMEAQLSELYEQDSESGSSDAAERLADIEDVLGISTREDAEELSSIARHMDEQLTDLQQEKKKLQDLGLDSIEDAVDMIQSMETQLAELYEDKEALRNVQRGGTDEQSTFQQLEALYAERQKLQEALGVSSADDVIEMVESLNTQLDDLYTGRDADVSPEERHEAQLWSPDESDDATASAPESDATAKPTDDSDTPVDSLTMNSMEQQLESLYREKETLLRHGFGSADEVVARLQTQKRQIDVLQRENHTYEQRFSRLQSELGTERVPRIVELVRTLESEADTSLDELDPPASDASEKAGYGVNIEATSPLVDPDTLARLDDMTTEELNTLDIGAVQLSDDGTIGALNEAALQLPSLRSIETPDDAIGQNFFLDLAPSTNNNLFFGRFRKGQSRGEIDARFPYTFTSPEKESESFAVHLYRSPDSDNTWLLFRPA